MKLHECHFEIVPGDIYSCTDSEIEEAIEGFEIVAFRPVQITDYAFLSAMLMVIIGPRQYMASPHLILRRK